MHVGSNWRLYLTGAVRLCEHIRCPRLTWRQRFAPAAAQSPGPSSPRAATCPVHARAARPLCCRLQARAVAASSCCTAACSARPPCRWGARLLNNAVCSCCCASVVKRRGAILACMLSHRTNLQVRMLPAGPAHGRRVCAGPGGVQLDQAGAVRWPRVWRRRAAPAAHQPLRCHGAEQRRCCRPCSR